MTERAFLTLSPTLGPGLWLGGRLVARIVATVEDSRVTPDEPEPRWKRDAMTFVNAVNALATPPVPAGPCADCGGDHASGHPWHTPPAPAGATLHDMDGHEECASDNCEVTRLCPRTSEPQFASPVPAGDERRDELIRRVTLLLGGDVPAVTIAAIVRYIDAAWPPTGDERLREAADLAADRLTLVLDDLNDALRAALNEPPR